MLSYALHLSLVERIDESALICFSEIRVIKRFVVLQLFRLAMSAPLSLAFTPVSELLAANSIPPDKSAWIVCVPPSKVMNSDVHSCLAKRPLSWAIHNESSGPLSPSDPILIGWAGKHAGKNSRIKTNRDWRVMMNPGLASQRITYKDHR